MPVKIHLKNFHSHQWQSQRKQHRQQTPVSVENPPTKQYSQGPEIVVTEEQEELQILVVVGFIQTIFIHNRLVT